MIDRITFPQPDVPRRDGGQWPRDEAEVREHICRSTGLRHDQVTEDADLVALGVDSIFVLRTAALLRRNGVRVGSSELAARPTPAAWWELVLRNRREDRARESAPVVVDESAPFPLATMQHAFWLGRSPGQELGGVAAHFCTELETRPGEGVDPERLGRALRAVVERHGMLRVLVGPDGTQRIGENGGSGLTVHDLRDLPDDEVQARLARIRERLANRAGDLAAGEVFEIELSSLPSGASRLHLNLEMVAADALSLRTVLADLAHLYRTPDDPLPPLRFSYPRYLAERAASRRDARERARAWWADRLPGLPGPPALPVGTEDTGGFTRRHHWFSGDDVLRLRERAAAHSLTPAAVLAAVFAETIAAWSSTDRFLLNLPVFYREPLHEDVDGLVGDFSSSVLLDVDMSAPLSFAQRAHDLQSRLRETLGHAEYTGVEVLRDLSRLNGGERVLAPVVHTSALGLGELFGREVRRCFGEPCWVGSQAPQVWLDAQVTEFDGGILANWDAREGLFPPGVLDAMFDAYTGLVRGLLDGGTPWDEAVPSLLPPRQREVREKVNDTAGPPPGAPLHERFFAHALSTPDSPALLWGEDGSLSYGELATRALRVAALLRARGVGAGDSVGITVPKGVDQVVAVLGVLAAGAAYVPSGVDVPPARRAAVHRAAGVRYVLCDRETAAVPAGPEALVLDDSAAFTPLSAPVAVEREAVMYVIFTSGSTGVPKGVEVPHRAVANTVDAVGDLFGVGQEDRTIALSALDFDLSAYDLFAFLGSGGSVVVPDEGLRRDAAAWAELIRHWRVTVVSAVPALLDMLLVAADGPGLGDSLRLVMLGGDRVTPDLPHRLRELVPGCRFAGLGGMTEAAVHATACEVGEADPRWRAVPYGTPLRNVTCRVVDSRGRDCPDWVAGELWVSGAGLAHGYRGDPVRTAEKFVEHDGRRWYRTGDLTRYLPDGTVEFLGRTDHQVKIRGHRIELGEVEAVLTGHPLVDAAVATVVLTASRQLAAAVVAPESLEPAALRTWLAGRVPGYLVPEHLSVVEALPLTPNGKIDRKAVHRALQAGAGRRGSPVSPAPLSPVERAVAEVWRDLLDVEEVGPGDDFFALGGDSLLATSLMSGLGRLGLRGAELADLFTTPVLRDFAARLVAGDARPESVVRPDPGHRYEPFPLTDVQRAFWIGRDGSLPLGGVGSHFYVEFEGADVDLSRVEEAWNRLVARHEMLRAVIAADGTQRILPEVPRYRIRATDAGHRPEATLHRLRTSLSHQLFDTSTWPLFDIRAVHHVSGGRRCTRLHVGLDSIVMDGRSIMVLLAEWARLSADPDAVLPPLGLSYRDYVLQVRPDPERLGQAREYWRGRVRELPPPPALPLAGDPAASGRPTFHRRHHDIGARTWASITARAREHGLTPSAVLLACYAEVLGAWSDQRDLTVTLTLFDRNDVHPDVHHVVGDFASLLLVSHHRDDGEAFAENVRALQEQQGRGLSHREASGIWALRELARRRGTASASVPVVFTSVLGVDVPSELSGPFAEQVYGVTQTPQVWLDNKVARSGGGITVDWDAVEDLFPDGVVDAMFDGYVRLVESLAEADWSAPLPLSLTPDDVTLRNTALEARVADRQEVARPGPSATAVEEAVARVWAEVLGVREVRRSDGFFELGGDSILATRLMVRLGAEGLAGAELARLFTHPVLHEFAATITHGAATAPAVLAADEEHRHDPFPLTDVQAAYWVGRSPDFRLGGIGAQLYVEYEHAELDVPRLERAWNRLVARHEMLRAVVTPDGMQRVLPEVPDYAITVVDGGESPEHVQEQVRELMCHGAVDVESWPLFDIRVMTRANGTARLCVAFDNIAVDGLSILTLLAEWDALYRDPQAALPPIGVSFRDYVLGTVPEPEVLAEALEYWRGRMTGLPPGPELPLRARPAEIVRPRFERRERGLGTARWRAVTERAKAFNVTPSVVLFSCYTLVLGAWSASRDLTVNMTLFDRRDVHPDIGRVVGDFTSLLLVADRPEPGESWLGRVRRLQEQVWRDLGHQQVSGVRVLRELARENARLAEPVPVVFTSMLGVDDALAAAVRWPDRTRSQTPQVWLDHQVIELPDGLLLSWDSVDELFPEGVVDAMFDAYCDLVSWLAEGDWTAEPPDLLPAAQRSVREKVNATTGPEPESTLGGGLLHGAFFEQAAAHPDRVAVVESRGGRLTYGELAHRARHVAGMLADHGVRPGDPVAVTLPKGGDQVAALLGVLAVGAAYVPVSADQPPVRAARMLDRAGAAFLLGDGTPRDGVRSLSIRDAERFAPLEAIGGAPDGLAYVLFTSGSTGEPKGVEIRHRSAVNTVADVCDRYGVGPDDRVLALSAADFDLSVFDLFGLLGSGGTVVLVAEDERRDPQRWLALAREHRVTVWNSVPAVFDMLLTAAETGAGLPDSLRLVLLSGDWVGLDLPARLARQTRCALVALGGATEASIWSNACDAGVADPGWASVPYGFPLRNQRFRVVDEEGRDRPDWVPGELWIGGTGVARGYRGDPELTAARFLDHDGTSWYRTGDVGRYWPDGTLEFLGRRDDQVKIRGHRVEMGEVEAAVSAFPGVRHAVAAAVAGRDGKRLVAFVRAEEDAPLGDLPGFLAERLPGHAIPGVVRVDGFPLTANGKVDRTALAGRLVPAGEPVARESLSGRERVLADLWGELLDRAPGTGHDNFFALGGDSLSATRLVQLVRGRFGVTVSLRDFFADPTVAHLAAAVGHAIGSQDEEEGSL
ncbi:amino acid adenylation domain-containing protein [Lentzea fradiae]|uniref:Phenyloxazoline synthase MbtB n=1 Tax=Lentzea fradiae TaxID=200378 RepID=A0A1G7L151_9PSEU|nr:non-ribosomal peptide synthetase [Lentzea fradiae]SDF43195.1 amino acid adenylation domain-containing protein [Lentzea fradiae]